MKNILKKISHPLNVEAIELLLEKQTQSFCFPLDTLAEKIKSVFQLDTLEFKRINATYKTSDAFISDLSKELLTLCFCDTKTSNKCFIALSFSSAQQLMQLFEKKQDDEALMQNEEIINAYCKYLSSIFLQNIKDLDLVDDISLELCQKPLPKKDCYVLDIQVISLEKNIGLRLIFEPEFLKQMNNAIKRKKRLFESTDDLATINLNLSPTLDTIKFKQTEIDQLSIGDVILINTQFQPKENKGSFTLNLEQLPIAYARYKEGKIKVLEAIKNSQESDYNG